MPWGVAAAAIGVGGSILQSNATSKAAKSAAGAQQAAQDQLRQDLAPYSEVGPNALLQTGNAAGLNGAGGQRGSAGSLSAVAGLSVPI